MNEPIDQKKVFHKQVREKPQIYSLEKLTRETLIKEQKRN